MTHNFYYSDNDARLEWASAQFLKSDYGSKGALLTTLPRSWTPEFLLIPYKFIQNEEQNPFENLSEEEINSLKIFCKKHENVILRSSVIGETIWDRGSYKSIGPLHLEEKV